MKTFKQFFYEAAVRGWQKFLDTNEELAAAFELLREIENKTGSTALLVGGCVRDLLMGKEPKDIDIASSASVEQIAKHFKAYDLGQSAKFGITVVKYKGFDFEVAQFRTDVYDDTANSRHPTGVKNVKSFADDSARRDLTINSLGIDKNGEIVDYQGGLEDLNNKILRAVGDPRQRFEEDALRIARLLRFSVKLGFDIEENTLQAAKELAHLVDKLSKERIKEEIYKVASISGAALANYIEKLEEVGLLEKIFPEFYALKGLQHDPKHHPESPYVTGHVLECLKYSRSNDPVINLSIFSHDWGKQTTYNPRIEKNGKVRIHTYDGHDMESVRMIKIFGQRMKLSNNDIEAMQFAAYRHMVLHNPERLSKSKLADIVNNKHWPVLREVVYCDEMSRGDVNGQEVEAKLQAVEDSVKQGVGDPDTLKQKLKSLIDGRKLMEWIPDLNVRENKVYISQVMKRVHEHIIDNNLFEITEDEVKQLAQDFYAEFVNN